MKPVLLGDLGAHARGRTLAAAAAAAPGPLPAHGVALAFAKEAQQAPALLEGWTTWAEQPGRVLVLLPPFHPGACERPVHWEARRAEPLAGGETELARTLARERQYELRGGLAPSERAGGQVVTGHWRRHPAAGLVVVTALPLWSLQVLDHRSPLLAWLEQWVKAAGTPRPPQAAGPTAGFRLAPADWVVLLHLCTGPYPAAAAALQALADSRLLRLDGASARAALARLQAAGMVREGALTAAGRAALAEGPYALHAQTLEGMRHD